MGKQTVADVVGATAVTPSRTKATYTCNTGYEKRPGSSSEYECQYTKKTSFALQGDCDCGTGGFQCVPSTCTVITPTGTGRFDADGDGKYDYWKMIDTEMNEYYIYWLSRKSPYEAYDTLLLRGQSGWLDDGSAPGSVRAPGGGRQSNMAGSTCLMVD